MTSTVSAAEVSKNFGACQDAAVREPVIITRNGRPRTILIAYRDILHFVPLSRRDQRVQRSVDLSVAEMAAVKASEMAPGSEYLNAECDSKNAAD